MIGLKKIKANTNGAGDYDIAVLGTGCKNCKTLLANVEEAVRVSGSELRVGYVTELREIAKYGVMVTPALAFGRDVVSAGEVLSVEEVAELIRRHSEVGE